MIKIEHVETAGWEAAIRGMRNPMNSWKKSDSTFDDGYWKVGPHDKNLAMNLRNAGVEHRKYMRMIAVWCDITAPLYWWKQFDTYKIGTVANSCSTMHKIHAKEFTLDDFSIEDIDDDLFIYEGYAGERFTPKLVFELTLDSLNECRNKFLKTENLKYWNTMVKTLPDSYNQKRTVMLNYEVLAKMYKERRHHKLQEWHDICDWMKTLPASELIVGEE